MEHTYQVPKRFEVSVSELPEQKTTIHTHIQNTSQTQITGRQVYRKHRHRHRRRHRHTPTPTDTHTDTYTPQWEVVRLITFLCLFRLRHHAVQVCGCECEFWGYVCFVYVCGRETDTRRAMKQKRGWNKAKKIKDGTNTQRQKREHKTHETLIGHTDPIRKSILRLPFHRETISNRHQHLWAKKKGHSQTQTRRRDRQTDETDRQTRQTGTHSTRRGTIRGKKKKTAPLRQKIDTIQR